MELKPGYKQTEVGVIPENWAVKPFQSLATIERGKFTARPRNDPKYYGGEIPFIQTGDVTNSRGWIKAYQQTLNSEGLKVSKLFPRGTLFFTIAANIGDVGFASFATACPDSLVGITPARGIDKHWLAHELGNRKPLFENLASHNAQLNLSLEKLKPYLLPVPTLAEQEAISEALSDADALIESLEQLLTKKRDLKQAAMQQLLTGQTRLSGFSGEWEPKRLSEIASIRNQKVLPSNVGIDTPCVELDHIGQGNGRLLEFSTAQNSKSPKYRFFSGDVLFGRLRSYLRKFWHADRDGICTTEIWPLMTDSQQVDSGFLHAIVQSDRFIEAASISYGTHMPRADWGVLRNFEVRLPRVCEQLAIADVLTDMDAELAALEARRDKTRDLKQAMMQELLTGKTRLVAVGGAHA